MAMKTQSLQFKILFLVAGSLAFVLAISIFALSRVYASIEDLDRVSREDFQTKESILKANVAFQQQLLEWKNLLLRGKDQAALDKHWKAFQDREKEASDLAKEARASAGEEDVRSRMQAFLDAHEALGARYRKALDAFKAAGLDPSAGDKASEGAGTVPTTLLVEASGKAEDAGASAVLRAVKTGETVYRYAIITLVTSMAGALVLLWWFLRRAVLQPLRFGADVAERIAGGDLTVSIRSHSKDEAGQLLQSLARMNDGLTRVVSQVRTAAHAVASASSQVSAGTTDLSQRTEEQASSLEETAASMEELASTVRQNADNAREADALARNASKRAQQGGNEVVNVVETMGEISDSAKRIADIISVIDGIAFQTNILALNAAVEAARAGEQGRGFAVVAAEVRSLAQRSAQAAKEIKDLINASLSRVQNGTHLVEQAGDTIQALVIDVKRVSDLMGSIAEASSEQARGVQQVNKTVTEMDRVVQQNAAAVQQSATAAESMRRHAESLVRAVGAFQLTSEDRSDPAHEPQPGEAPTLMAPAPRRAAVAIGSTTQARSATAPVAAHGDDWEEF